MHTRRALAGLLSLATLVPAVASAAVILEQPDFSQINFINGDSPVYFSGAMENTPQLVSWFNASGTVRTVKVRYDLLSGPGATGVQAYLYECPQLPGDSLPACRIHVAQDAALGWDGGLIHPADPDGNELAIDFSTTTDFAGHDLTDGLPLDPTRAYHLELAFTPNNYTANVSGVSSSSGAFLPFFKLEGDLATSSTATSTPATSTPACIPGQDPNCNSNVMFLPGIEGSRLYDTENGETRLWESDNTSALKLAMNVDGTSLRQDVYTRDVLDTAHVGFIGVAQIYEPFISIMDYLKDTDKIEDWKVAPYDWRLSLDQIVSNGLKNGENISYIIGTSTPYIEQTLKQLAASSRTQKVTIVAHSNGGLVIKMLLTAHPELGQFIDKIIFVAVPNIGTPQAIEALMSGRDETIPVLVRAATIRSLAQNMPTSYNLLPSAEYFNVVDDPVVSFDSSTMQDWISTYGTAEIHSSDRLRAFMLDAGHTTIPSPQDTDFIDPIRINTALFNAAEMQHGALDNWEPPVSIRIIEIAGWGRETLSGIKYKRAPQNVCVAYTINGDCSAFQPRPVKLTFEPVHIIDGDGTVVEPSALWIHNASTTRYWLNLQQNGLSHPDLFKSTSLLNFIQNTITGSDDPAPLITTTAPASQLNRLHFILHSPLTIGFFDEQGAYTGSTATTTRAEVDGINYENFGEVQWLSVPKTLSGKVQMRGVDSGSFTLDINEVNGNDVISSTSFAGIPSSTSTVASITISSGSRPTENGSLNIDFDGDGIVDRTLQAREGNIVLPDIVSPEALVTVSTTSKDLVINGIDLASTSVTKTATSTTIIDTSGNKTMLFFKKTFSGNVLTYARLTGINYGTTTIALPTSFLYVWDSSKTLVSQTIVVDKQFAIEAIYDKKRNKTTVIVYRKGLPIQNTALTGLRVVKLATYQGLLTYSW